VNFFRLSVFLAYVISSAAADYATYIGEADAYTVTGIAVDSIGDTYATGYWRVAVSPAGTAANDVCVTEVDGAGNVTAMQTALERRLLQRREDFTPVKYSPCADRLAGVSSE
jgi:hypothetical protein